MKILKNISDKIIFLILPAIILFAFWDLPKTFFQQDEWQGIGGSIYFASKGLIGVVMSFLPSDPISHFNPLSRGLSWFEYIFYQTNFLPYAWQSISLHIINAILLYYFVSFWLKNKKIAGISALIFAVNSIPSQAVTWVAAVSSYEIPLIFILLSLIFFQKREILLSLAMLFISLLFHETGIFLLVFYPIILLINRKDNKKSLKKLTYGMIIFIAVFFLIRIPFFFGINNTVSEVTDISHPPAVVFPYRLISITMKSFAGNFFSENSLIGISEKAVRLAYPQFLTADNIPNPYIAQSIVFDLVSYMISVLVICLTVLIIKFSRDKKLSEALVWSAIFIPSSLLPYAFILGKAGYASILEPKFFYISGIGSSILVTVIFLSFTQKVLMQKLLKLILYFFGVTFILFNISSIRTNISNLVELGKYRKMFLVSIENSNPKLPSKAIFFTQSNTVYYGMPDKEKILPVEVGFGKMLMIWYQKEETFPGCIYENNFLLDILAQGYKECGGRGFGYFRDYDKLVSAVKANTIPVGNVISYSWNGDSKEFANITLQVQDKLKKDLYGNQK